jgi:hypothetical protein
VGPVTFAQINVSLFLPPICGDREVLSELIKQQEPFMRLPVYFLSPRMSAKLQGRLPKMPTLARRLKQEQLPRVSKTARQGKRPVHCCQCGLQQLFHKEGQEGYVCASCGHQDTDCIDCLASIWWPFGCTQFARPWQELRGICSSVSHF